MTLRHQLLMFDDQAVDHFYLCHYRKLSAGADALSKSLLRFKSGWPLDVSAWTSCGAEAMRSTDWPVNTLFVRALNSTEYRTQLDTPLDILGKNLADAIHGTYEPSALRKTRLTRELKYLSKSERKLALHEVYELNEAVVKESPA